MNKQVAKHFKWASDCDGWHLLEHQDLSVIHEKMPPSSTENRHYHEQSRQLFFILKGKANLELEGEIYEILEQEAIEVAPKQRHRISNQSSHDVEFLVISQPAIKDDRIDLED